MIQHLALGPLTTLVDVNPAAAAYTWRDTIARGPGIFRLYYVLSVAAARPITLAAYDGVNDYNIVVRDTYGSPNVYTTFTAPSSMLVLVELAALDGIRHSIIIGTGTGTLSKFMVEYASAGMQIRQDSW